MTRILIPLLLCATAVLAKDDSARWVTFKTGHNKDGVIQHQIDRDTIRQDGPYRMFWTRVWEVGKRQPLIFTVNEKMFFLSQNFVVDCKGGRFGALPLESNRYSDRVITPQQTTWVPLAQVPVVEKSVCR